MGKYVPPPHICLDWVPMHTVHELITYYDWQSAKALLFINMFQSYSVINSNLVVFDKH